MKEHISEDQITIDWRLFAFAVERMSVCVLRKRKRLKCPICGKMHFLVGPLLLQKKASPVVWMMGTILDSVYDQYPL